MPPLTLLLCTIAAPNHVFIVMKTMASSRYHAKLKTLNTPRMRALSAARANDNPTYSTTCNVS